MRRRAFKSQHIRIMICLILNGPMTKYKVAEHKDGLNSRQRSGEIISYFNDLLRFGFIVEKKLKKKIVYELNEESDLIILNRFLSNFRKPKKEFFIELLSAQLSNYRLNEKGELCMDKNFNERLFMQEMNAKYESVNSKNPFDVILLSDLANDSAKQEIKFI